LSINNARAVLEGLFGIQSEFVRTPKHGIKRKDERWISKRYKAAMGSISTYLELLFGVYFVVTIGLAIVTGSWMNIPFLVVFMVGFLYVGTLSLHQLR
ncbi:MAG: glycosyl transferase family 2, partial [Polyangiales bacterium]